MRDKIKYVIVYGGTGQAKVVRPIIEYYPQNPRVVLVVNDDPHATPPYPDVPFICGKEELENWVKKNSINTSEYGFVVAIGNPNGGARITIAKYMKSMGFIPYDAIHPHAVIAKNAKIGEGIQVMAGAIIQDEVVIGDQCLINTNSSIDHECILGDGIEVGPRAVVCGSVTVQDRAWIAAGATVLPWLKIGEDAVAGAGSVVTASIPKNEVWVGVPARYMRQADYIPNPQKRIPEVMSNTMHQHIWEGIYPNFNSVKNKNDAFNESQWVANSLKKLRQLNRDEKTFSMNYPGQDGLLPFLVSTAFSSKKSVRVLDFGGGIGITYAQMVKSISHRSVTFQVVEKPAVCKAATSFFRKDRRIRFSSTIPKKKFDIVHIKSALQYIDDWKGALAELATLKPAFFLCVDLFAGNIPSYVTAQNYYGRKIPCRFFNGKEILKEMEELGFEQIYQHHYDSTFLGKVGNFPQENFPKKYQLGKSLNVLFFNKDNS